MLQPLSDHSIHLSSPDASATHAIGGCLAQIAAAGVAILLEGPVGAGKTELARAVIQTLLAATGNMEDVPSPTFTLVQTYTAADLEIWHADLYRLSDPYELIELGLEEAFESAFCLIEWPDRLPPDFRATSTITVSLSPGTTPESRTLRITAPAEITKVLRQRLTKWL